MTKEEFLEGVSDWCSHRPLLWWALNYRPVKLYPVVEFGSGEGSTEFLRKYCEDENTMFRSFDSSEEWAAKTGAVYIEDWRTADIYQNASIILVDNAPGEMRHEIMAIMKDRAELIIVHDSEPAATGYLLDRVWPLFKYRYDYKVFDTWATVVSNTIDVSLIKDL